MVLLPTLALLSLAGGDDLDAIFELPDGLEVTLWAESPHLYNPAAIDVDERGRVWVAEAVNYRQWNGRNPGRHHDEGDRIVILEDTNGDGVCDSSKVFVQDPDLTAPLGVALVGDRVYVSCSPNLYAYVDEDGDDVPDRRETILTGFGGHDHDHGLHSVVPHVDGKLYVAIGNAGPHVVTGPDGWTLRSGSLYTGGGRTRSDNMPGLVSDDGRVWTGGLILRMDHDGTNLEVMAHNFRNPYEVAVDAFGNLYTADNDDDGNQSCRTTWVMPGGDYGFTGGDGRRRWQADRRPGLTTQEAHWHQRDPGVAPAGTINGAGGPTGVCVYEGELMSRWIDGAVLNCDAGARVVYAHRPQAKGAGIELEPGWLIRPAKDAEGRSGDWFRPSDVAVGPGGDVYVCDWFDPGVGGHAARDREAYGRILRIAPRGSEPRLPELDLFTKGGALAALQSPAVAVRELGRQALGAMGAAGHDAAGALVFLTDAPLREKARALQVATDLDVALREQDLAYTATSILGSPDSIRAFDPRLVALALDALTERGRLLKGALGEIDPTLPVAGGPPVARALAAALAASPMEEAHLSWVLSLASSFDPSDPWAVEAMGQLFDGCEDEAFAELSAELADTPLAWNARFEALAWRLHSASAVPAFFARAMSPQLDEDARRRAIDALAFVPTLTAGRAAADAVMTIATAGPEDLRGYAAWWVESRGQDDWREFGLRIATGSLADAERAWASGVMRAGVKEIDVDVAGAEKLWLVVTDGGDGNSYDWAAWAEPRWVMDGGGEVALGGAWLSAEAGWGSVQANRDPSGGSLEFASGPIAHGIGVHARSEVAVVVPDGAQRFRARSGPEKGGTDQVDGKGTTVEFEVWLERPPAPKPLAEWAGVAFGDEVDAAARLAAAMDLAADGQGALLLIDAQERGALPAELVGPVSEALFRHTDLAVRALASAHFERPGQPDAPSIAELMALEGDARRGRALFAASATANGKGAQCATCHAFRSGESRLGVDLGPELTEIAKKLEPEALFDAILNPSADIAFGYDTYVIATDDGLLHSGFMLADGDVVALLGTNGERIVLDAGEITGRKKQATSTMPEGAALDLSPQDLADLVAFLSEDPEREPEYGDEVVLFDGSSMDAWTYHLSNDSKSFDDVWEVRGDVLRCGGRPAGYIRTNEKFESYRLTLEWRFDPEAGPGNSGVLLRTVGDDKVWPRSIEAQLQHRNAGDFWNIDRFGMRPDPSRTRGRNTKRAAPASENPVGEWNRYDILVDGPRVELRVNGVLQNVADWCEEVPGYICLQSEGAVIEFRNVRLRPIKN